MEPRQVRFTVDGNPVPKARPRVVVSVSGKAHGYTPKRTRWWEQHVAFAARLAMNEAGHAEPFRCPVMLEVNLYLANHRRTDADNHVKAVLDSLNGVVWNDDVQVVQLHCYKRVDAKRPRVEIYVREVFDDESS